MEVKRVLLKDYTTLGVGGPAELWLVETLDDLHQATEAPYRVLGNGSNLLIADEGVEERVIKLGSGFARWDLHGWVGAGALLPLLVQEAAREGLSGLEPLLGIPASVGGAVRMNAGTRFGSIADVLAEVEYYHQGSLKRVPPEALGFGYRKSDLPAGSIVTRVRFNLKKKSLAYISERMRQVDLAREGQPKRKSAGCAFKNPPGDAAGRLIDAAGFKGLRRGQAMVSLEHGNFIVNLGGAKAREVWALVEEIRKALPLELEWEVWGRFS
jgi:UDP-N-acetylenolpyruvoylglucosamine reductase